MLRKKQIPLLLLGWIGALFMTPIAISFAATVPDAPTNASAIPLDGSAEITFTPPKSDGGSPITSFVISTGPNPLAPSRMLSANSSSSLVPISYTFTPLINGTQYTFYITAVNAIGSSAYASTGTIAPRSSQSGTTSPGSGGNGGTTSPGSDSGSSGNIQIQIQNPLPSSKDLPSLFVTLLKAVVDLLFPVVVIMILYAGFLFVTARGNQENLIKAKATLMYTVIGAAIVLGSYGLIQIIQSVLTSFAS